MTNLLLLLPVNMTKQRKPRLHVIQDEVDQGILKRVNGHPVSCHAGCSNCCQQWVGVMWKEAQEAVAEAALNGFIIDRQELAKQARMALDPSIKREDWFGTKCIFLSAKGTCGAYSRRPISCRAVLVASSPRECGNPKGRVLRYNTLGTPEKPGPVMKGFSQMRTEHQTTNTPDTVAALPLYVDMVLRNQKPERLGDKMRPGGIIGA